MAIKPSDAPDPSLEFEGDIVQEFGPPAPGSRPHNISEYYRGGVNVPDIPSNATIPASGEVSFSDYYGAVANLPTTGNIFLSNSQGTAIGNIAPGTVIYINAGNVEDENGLTGTNNWNARFVVGGSVPNYTSNVSRNTNGTLTHTYTVTEADALNDRVIYAEAFVLDDGGNLSATLTSNTVTASLSTSYSIFVSDTDMTEGGSKTFVINVSNPLSGGETLDYQITGQQSSLDRITTDLTGDFTITGNQAQFLVSTSSDNFYHGGTTFQLSITGRVSGKEAISSEITILDLAPSVNFRNATITVPTSVDEGDDIVIPAGSLEGRNIKDATDILFATTEDLWVFDAGTIVLPSRTIKRLSETIDWEWVSAANLYRNSADISFPTLRDESVFTDGTVELQFVIDNVFQPTPIRNVAVNNIFLPDSYSFTVDNTNDSVEEGNDLLFTATRTRGTSTLFKRIYYEITGPTGNALSRVSASTGFIELNVSTVGESTSIQETVATSYLPGNQSDDSGVIKFYDTDTDDNLNIIIGEELGSATFTITENTTFPDLPASVTERAGGDPDSVFVAVRLYGNGEIRTAETGIQETALKGTWVPIRDYGIAYRVRLTDVTESEGIPGNLVRSNPVPDGQYIALPTTPDGFVEWGVTAVRIEPDPGVAGIDGTLEVNQTGTNNSDSCNLVLEANTSNEVGGDAPIGTTGGTSGGGTGVLNPDGPPPEGGENP